MVFGHPRTAKAHSREVNADIKPNREKWWHVNGPEWLEPYLKLIAAGKVLKFAPGTSDKEKKPHQHLFAKAKK